MYRKLAFLLIILTFVVMAVGVATFITRRPCLELDGSNIYLPGVTSYIDNSGKRRFDKDECVVAPDGQAYLNEHFCQGPNHAIQYGVPCPKGCSHGTCHLF